MGSPGGPGGVKKSIFKRSRKVPEEVLAGALKNCSLGGRREVVGRSRGPKIALGGLRGPPGGTQEAPKMGPKTKKSRKRTKAEKRPPKMRWSRRFWVPIWDAFFGLWGTLGRLGDAFLDDLVAHRFCIDFLSIFRPFGDRFWYQNSKKKRITNEADFGMFF